MSIFTDLKNRFLSRTVRDYVEQEVTGYVAEKHHAVIMRTLLDEFPELSGETVSTVRLNAMIQRANQRLLQHII